MRQAVLNPVRNTCFVTLAWLVCKVAGGPSRTPAPCQGRSPKPATTRAPRGDRDESACGAL
eukprot:6282274-Prymnesium_polylepis.1